MAKVTSQDGTQIAYDRSFPFMPMSAEAVTAALPNATHKVLPGQDHGPEPDAIAPVIRELLGA